MAALHGDAIVDVPLADAVAERRDACRTEWYGSPALLRLGDSPGIAGVEQGGQIALSALRRASSDPAPGAESSHTGCSTSRKTPTGATPTSRERESAEGEREAGLGVVLVVNEQRLPLHVWHCDDPLPSRRRRCVRRASPSAPKRAGSPCFK